MFRLFLSILFVCFGTNIIAETPHASREQYVQQIYNAFLMQSIGETRLAYRTFKNGYQEAQKAGESSKKLDAMNAMFSWYRKYGWSLGLMTKPCNCAGESLRSLNAAPFNAQIQSNSQVYVSEWGKSPQQAKYIRNFMFGVAEITVGVFAVSIGTPIGYVIAGATIYNGLTRCWDSFNDTFAEYEERMLEFKKVEAKALEAIK